MARGNSANLKPPFKKGHKPVGAGRPKGVPNKTTTLLKEAVLLAAELTGQDGKGKDGLTGYLRMLAVKYPQSYVQLLNRVLPLQISGTIGVSASVIHIGMTAKEAAEIYADTLKSNNPAPAPDTAALPPPKLVASKR